MFARLTNCLAHPLEEIERQAVVEALKMSNRVQKDAAERRHRRDSLAVGSARTC